MVPESDRTDRTCNAIGAVLVSESNWEGEMGGAIGVVPVLNPDRVGAVEPPSSSLESDEDALQASSPDALGSANELKSSVS